MKIWNYIGEFFLFRWLFGKLAKPNREDITPTTKRSGFIDLNRNNPIAEDNEYPDSIHDTIITAKNNLSGNSEDDEDPDDLDIFMRNNITYNSLHSIYNDDKYHSSSRYDGHHDWNAQNFEQSFDDFHEEQDDYDMVDDF